LNNGQIRKSVIAGTWYPGRKEALRTAVETYFSQVTLNSLSEALEGEVKSLISPHAGYIYSGQIAAYAYRTVLEKKYDAVIVAGPSHRIAFHGVSVYDEGGYETPLGVVPIDVELAKLIVKEDSSLFAAPEKHIEEHSIEIQLPFLQVALGNFRFVPLLMGDQDRRTCEHVAGAISRAAKGRKILVVGSSDLSHYHAYHQAVKLDAAVLKTLEDFDPQGLLDGIQNRSSEACGGGPMALAMMVAKELGADQAKVLKYLNSGDVTGDKSGVVGYTAAAFYQRMI
jgi:MEMO1 family protein